MKRVIIIIALYAGIAGAQGLTADQVDQALSLSRASASNELAVKDQRMQALAKQLQDMQAEIEKLKKAECKKDEVKKGDAKK